VKVCFDFCCHLHGIFVRTSTFFFSLSQSASIVSRRLSGPPTTRSSKWPMKSTACLPHTFASLTNCHLETHRSHSIVS
jgi:hypothetical protein